jgi:hypothetical protein
MLSGDAASQGAPDPISGFEDKAVASCTRVG